LHFELISDTFQSFFFAGLDQATKLIDPTGLEYDVPVQHYNPNKPFPQPGQVLKALKILCEQLQSSAVSMLACCTI
jgi:hypothetical protein